MADYFPMCFIPHILISILYTDDVVIDVIVTIRYQWLSLGNVGLISALLKLCFKALPQVRVARKRLKAQAVICFQLINFH